MTGSLRDYMNGGLMDWVRKNWPILVLLVGFIIRVEVFMGRGPRFTKEDGEVLQAEIMLEFHKIMEDHEGESHPGVDERLDEIMRTLDRHEQKIDRIMELSR